MLQTLHQRIGSNVFPDASHPDNSSVGDLRAKDILPVMGSKHYQTIEHYGDKTPNKEDPGVVWSRGAVDSKDDDASHNHRDTREGHHPR